MSTVEAIGLSSPAINAAKTGAAPPQSLATSAAEWLVEEWDAVLDQLIDLAPKHNDPEERLDDDGYILPSGQAIVSASDVAARLRSEGETAPSAVIQDAVGGIVFEWASGQIVERLVINRRGEMELVVFRNSQMMFRRPVSIVRDLR
jgi:hypothetical protein